MTDANGHTKLVYNSDENIALKVNVQVDGGPIEEEDSQADTQYQWSSNSGIPITPQEALTMGKIQQCTGMTLNVMNNQGYSFSVSCKVVSSWKISFPEDSVIVHF